MPAVGRWRARFGKDWLAGPAAAPRPDQPRKISDAKAGAGRHWIRKTKCRYWIARSRCCPCAQVRRNAKHTTTSGLEQPRWTLATARLAANAARSIAARSSCASLSGSSRKRPRAWRCIWSWTTMHTQNPKVERWFKARPRCHLLYTPTFTLWLNQVERRFAKLTEHASMAYTEQYKRPPLRSLFVWIGTAI